MAKICMVVHKNYHHDVRVRRYVESLVAMGKSVDVLCPDQDSDAVFESHERIRIYVIPIRHADNSQIRYVLEYFVSFWLYFICLSILHIRNHYALIHVHNMPDFLIFSAIIPKLMGVPLILDIHDPMPEVFLSKYGRQPNKIFLAIIKLQERLSCKLADEVITVNSTCAINLVNRGIPSKKITVVHNYPNATIFDRSLYPKEINGSKKNFTLIYPGTLAPRYGLETIIRALPQLKVKIPEIRLLIFGPNTPYKDKLSKLAEQLDVSAHVELKPLIRNDEIPYQLMAADVGVYPANKDVHMNLATPTKVLEFSAMGIPVVASRLQMIEEIFGNSAIKFFEPGNISQFSECILDLYRDPILRQKLSTNAYQIFVQKLSWNHEFQTYLKLLHRLFSETNKMNDIRNDKKFV